MVVDLINGHVLFVLSLITINNGLGRIVYVTGIYIPRGILSWIR